MRNIYKYNNLYTLFYNIPMKALMYVKETGKPIKINIAHNKSNEICIIDRPDTTLAARFKTLKIFIEHDNIIVKIGDSNVYYDFGIIHDFVSFIMKKQIVPLSNNIVYTGEVLEIRGDVDIDKIKIENNYNIMFLRRIEHDKVIILINEFPMWYCVSYDFNELNGSIIMPKNMITDKYPDITIYIIIKDHKYINTFNNLLKNITYRIKELTG